MNSNEDTSHLSDERAKKFSTDPNFRTLRRIISSGRKPEDTPQEVKEVISPQESNDE